MAGGTSAAGFWLWDSVLAAMGQGQKAPRSCWRWCLGQYFFLSGIMPRI